MFRKNLVDVAEFGSVCNGGGVVVGGKVVDI